MPSAVLHEPADVCVLPSNAVQKPGGALGLARWASGWPPRLALVGGILARLSRAGDLRRTSDRRLNEDHPHRVKVAELVHRRHHAFGIGSPIKIVPVFELM